ncbi:MAG: IS200/IS605 family transposase [bacterium]|nr:IS200/IS605 family transposase [bacterium]
MIKNSALYYQKMKKWWIHSFLLMLDHIHDLVSFNYSPDLEYTISNWKRYIARTYDVKWQRGFFDHRLRKEESYFRKEEYIFMNPVRGGLVEKPEDWIYSWRHNDL